MNCSDGSCEIRGEAVLQPCYEGDTVEAGATLIKLDPTELQSQRAIIESELFEMMARSARLKAERAGSNVLEFDAELEERAAKDPDIKELMEGQANLMQAFTRPESTELTPPQCALAQHNGLQNGLLHAIP